MFSNKLSNIFLYFPVCRQWRDVGRSSWSKFKKLNFDVDTWISKQDKRNKIYIQPKILHKVVVRAGKYLTSVDLHSLNHDHKIRFEMQHFEVLDILRCCPNIEELFILPLYMKYTICLEERENCKNEKHNIFYYLEPHCKSLIKLGLNCVLFCDTTEEIAILFQKMINLKSIHLENCNSILDSNCLQSLPLASLEEFMVRKIIIEDHLVEGLNSVISKCVDLQSISIVFCHNNWESMLDALCLHKNVKHLEIAYAIIFNRTDPSRKLESYLSQLTYLKKLDLSYSFSLDDKLLKTVVERCQQIEKLNITFCRDITDDGIFSVSTLKKLRHLIMNSMGDMVLCPSWKKMDCLEQLFCTSSELRCESLCDLVFNKAPNLKVLDVTNCRKVDNRLIDVALEAVKSREKYTVLILGVRRTKVRPTQKHKKSDRLNIIYKRKINLRIKDELRK